MAITIFTIALGIGATSSVFSISDRAMFQPLPYAQPKKLVAVGMLVPIEPREFMFGFSYFTFRREQKPFSAVTSWSGLTDCDITESGAVRLSCAQVEASFLRTFGIPPLLGDDFSPNDDHPNSPRVVLLSYGLWQSRYGGDPAVVGKTLMLDGQQVRITGVLPREFELPTLAHADMLVPQRMDESGPGGGAGRVVRVFGRLRDSVNPTQAAEQLQPLLAEFIHSAPPNFQKEIRLSVRPIRDYQTHEVRLTLWVLLAAVAAFLAIACANVANLFLARAASRGPEMAVRAALGAGRGRLIRQLLTESIVLSLAGGAAGCFLAWAALRFVRSAAGTQVPRLAEAALDGRILSFAFAVAVLSGILFGLAPAWNLPGRQDLSGARTAGGSRTRLSQALVNFQIAGSLVLLTASGLLLHALWNLERVPLGMDVEHVYAAQITLGRSSYAADPAKRTIFFESLEQRLAQLPGISSLALSDSLPPSGGMRASPYFIMQSEGRPQMETGTGGMVGWRAVSPEYFSALHIPILRGRPFTEADRSSGDDVVILNAALAQRLFGTVDAEGRRVRLSQDSRWYTVVGVAANVKGVVNNARSGGVEVSEDPEYELVRRHAPDAGIPDGGPGAPLHATMILRSSLPQATLAGFVRSAVTDLDPAVPVNLVAMRDRVSQLVARPRFDALLLTAFGVLSLVLAAVGLLGVISFLVSRQTREIGVRMALGATPQSVVFHFLGKAGRWTLAGAFIGLVGSYWVATLLRGLLFEVPRFDVVTWLLALIILLSVAGIAAWIPARRASQIDPMVALR
ncbi:MAG TPA: ABC transporter permease, partial [Candidatus Acidoferrum sp.]|nr:ABC transporter permease [Candidatus Acidoferrum sp.]